MIQILGAPKTSIMTLGSEMLRVPDSPFGGGSARGIRHPFWGDKELATGVIVRFFLFFFAGHPFGMVFKGSQRENNHHFEAPKKTPYRSHEHLLVPHTSVSSSGTLQNGFPLSFWLSFKKQPKGIPSQNHDSHIPSKNEIPNGRGSEIGTLVV